MKLKYFISGIILLVLSVWIFTTMLPNKSDIDGNYSFWPVSAVMIIVAIIFFIFSFKFEENDSIRWAFYLSVTAMIILLLSFIFVFIARSYDLGVGGNSDFLTPLIIWGSIFLCSVGSIILSVIGLVSAIFKK